MNISRNLPESSSSGKLKTTETKLLMESPGGGGGGGGKNRRHCPSSFFGTLPEEEWKVHHRDHENRTGCNSDRVAFMEEVWTVVQ